MPHLNILSALKYARNFGQIQYLGRVFECTKYGRVGYPRKSVEKRWFWVNRTPSQKLRQILFLPDFPHEIKIGRWGGPALRNSAQQVPEPDLLPGISFDTRPDSVLEIIG